MTRTFGTTLDYQLQTTAVEYVQSKTCQEQQWGNAGKIVTDEGRRGAAGLTAYTKTPLGLQGACLGGKKIEKKHDEYSIRSICHARRLGLLYYIIRR